MVDSGKSLTAHEVERLKATSTADAWQREIEEIKARRAGEYPRDWWPRIVQTGIYTRALARWRQS
jgi:hypothetical protein